jgi:hypothetical protein
LALHGVLALDRHVIIFIVFAVGVETLEPPTLVQIPRRAFPGSTRPVVKRRC